MCRRFPPLNHSSGDMNQHTQESPLRLTLHTKQPGKALNFNPFPYGHTEQLSLFGLTGTKHPVTIRHSVCALCLTWGFKGWEG